MKRNDLPDFLFKNIPRFEWYPENVSPVSEMCKTTAFFPGGRGLKFLAETGNNAEIKMLKTAIPSKYKNPTANSL